MTSADSPPVASEAGGRRPEVAQLAPANIAKMPTPRMAASYTGGNKRNVDPSIGRYVSPRPLVTQSRSRAPVDAQEASMMEREAGALRAELSRVVRGRGKRFAPELRRRVQRRRAEGARWAVIGA